MPPEPPIDPPDTETPVDHLAVAAARLEEVMRELTEANIAAAKRPLLELYANALKTEIARLR